MTSFLHSVTIFVILIVLQVVSAQELPCHQEIDEFKKGDEESVERLTHLLALKVLAKNWDQESEIIAAARYLKKHPDKSAQESLESLLEFPMQTKTVNFPNSQAILAEAWVSVATRELEEKQKIKILVGTFLPKFPARVQIASLGALVKIDGGIDSLYKSIMSVNETTFTTNDFLRIGEIISGIRQKAISKPNDEDLQKMLDSGVLFQEVFAACVLMIGDDSRAEAIVLKLVNLEALKAGPLRYMLISDIGYLSKKEVLFSKIVKLILKEPRSTDTGQFLLHLLLRQGSVSKNAGGRDAAMDALRSIVNLELSIPDTDKIQDYTTLRYYNAARIEARRLLKEAE